MPRSAFGRHSGGCRSLHEVPLHDVFLDGRSKPALPVAEFCDETLRELLVSELESIRSYVIQFRLSQNAILVTSSSLLIREQISMQLP